MFFKFGPPPPKQDEHFSCEEDRGEKGTLLIMFDLIRIQDVRASFECKSKLNFYISLLSTLP